METVITFTIEHWASISAIVAAVGLRLFPTEKNYDIFHKALRLLDLIIPNLKKGGGKHTVKILLFFVLACGYGNSFAQLNTTTRQLRFAQSVQKAADTATTSANKGRIWYDFSTSKFRKNENGTNSFLSGSGGSSYTFSNGLINTSGNVKLGGFLNSSTTIDITGWELNIVNGDGLGGSGIFTLNSTDALQTVSWGSLDGANYPALYYGGDYSLSFTDRSLVDKGYADTKIDGTMTATYIPYGVDANSLTASSNLLYSSTLGLRVRQVSTNQIFLVENASGGSVIDVTDGTIRFSGSGAQMIDILAGNQQIIRANNPTAAVETFTVSGANGVAGKPIGDRLVLTGGNALAASGAAGGNITVAGGDGDGAGTDGYVIILNIPTTSPCGTAPSGTLWNNTGVLNICP